MRTIAKAFGAIALGSLLPLSAQVTETEETTEVQKNPDGSITETKVVTTTFNPEARTKVVKYFETYKAERYGLPPAWVTRFKVKEIPADWRTTRVAPGVVIREKQRPYLVEAPPELVKVLPAPASRETRYYLAGGNVVAVDKGYRVVDSIQIPSVKITVED
jgi:hypothetical protein